MRHGVARWLAQPVGNDVVASVGTSCEAARSLQCASMKSFHRNLSLVVPFALLFGAASAASAEVRSGDTVVVSAEERVVGNLYITAATVLVHGVVDGDLLVAGGTIVVDGHVTGDVLAAGGDVEIRGVVDGDLRAAAGSLLIEPSIGQSSSVGGDVTVAGGDVTLTTAVGGSAFVAGDEVTIGDVGGDVLLAANEAAVLGKIAGDVDIGGNRARLEPRCAIAGHVVFTGEALVRSPGAVVVGTVVEHPTPSTAGVMFVMWLQGIVGICVFGALWFTLFRDFATRATSTLTQQPARSLWVGLLVLLVSPLVLGTAFAVGLVVGGWWIAAIGAAVYVTALATTFPLVAAAIAQRVMSHRDHTSGAAQTWAMLGMVVVLSIAAAIPVVGGLLGFAIAVFGLGAVVLTARPARAASTSSPQAR